MSEAVSTQQTQQKPSLSLFIPRVHNSMKEDDIKNLFDKLNLGVIKRVDIVIPGMKHDPYKEIEECVMALPDPLPLFNIAFVHYSSWNTECEQAMRFYKQCFDEEQEVRIVIDADGHFFKVYKNKNPKSDEQYELECAFEKQREIIKNLKATIEEQQQIIEDLRGNNMDRNYRTQLNTSF
jgi:hypothetical protein